MLGDWRAPSQSLRVSGTLPGARPMQGAAAPTHRPMGLWAGALPLPGAVAVGADPLQLTTGECRQRKG